MLELSQIWEQTIAPELKCHKEKMCFSGSIFDDRFVQASFEFSREPRVYFVKDTKTETLANYYQDILSIQLTDNEKAVITITLEQLKVSTYF